MNRALACWKLVRALWHAIGGWWTIRFTFPGLSQAERNATVERWSERMLLLLGVRLVVQGTPPAQGPMLVVSNHVSWLDILAFHAARHVRFVSKSGVRHWPLVGTLATGGGTLYIERERKRDALRVVHRMTEALGNGDLIGVFPEGTTSDGQALLPFHANLLQAAISSGAPVQPAALRFADAATLQTSLAPRYIDDDNLLSSLWRTLCAPPLVAIVRYGEPQSSAGRERREWAQSLRFQVADLIERTR